MPNMREIRERIASIQQILKITNAMYLMSSSKLKKARKALDSTEPYFYKLQETIESVLEHTPHTRQLYFDRRSDIPEEKRKKGYIGGYLSSSVKGETYGAQAILAWNYVNAHVNAQGQVEGTCVGTGLAFDPAFYAYRPVNNFAAHGYGPTLWAGAEIYQLVKTHHIKMNDSAVHFYPEDPQTNEPIFYVK